MTDDNKTTAEALAQALAAAGIKSHEVAVPLRITAMQTAEKAFYAVGAGNSTDWQELMQLRRESEPQSKHVDRKLAAACMRAIKKLKSPFEDIVSMAVAYGYFSAKGELSLGLGCSDLGG